MRVRLGYVAIALKLPKVTSSSTVTYATYSKLASEEDRLNKLKKITLSNLDDLYKILEYNIENKIHFYRITSALIPLCTHPEVNNWDYRKIFKKDFERIGRLINKSKMRVDTHPDQFNVINSVREDVVKNTQRNLLTHVDLFEDIGYPFGKMVLHVGSAEGGKEQAVERFVKNFQDFSKEITSKLILENDDKTFTAKEVLAICRTVKIPMVFDVHHHKCNNHGENLEEIIEGFLHTWNKEILPPKIHVSSPREGEKDRKHGDYIDVEEFVKFVEVLKNFNKDIDIMIEAKQKDLALYKLVEDIKYIRPNLKWIDESSFEL